MSYALSGPLQEAVYAALSTDADITALVGASVFDQAPGGEIPGSYISLGEESVKDASDQVCAGAIHELLVTVVTDEPGFKTAKQVAGVVCDVLIDADLPMSRGQIVSLSFVNARAVRTKRDSRRRIDLRFRVRVDDN